MQDMREVTKISHTPTAIFDRWVNGLISNPKLRCQYYAKTGFINRMYEILPDEDRIPRSYLRELVNELCLESDVVDFYDTTYSRRKSKRIGRVFT